MQGVVGDRRVLAFELPNAVLRLAQPPRPFGRNASRMKVDDLGGKEKTFFRRQAVTAATTP